MPNAYSTALKLARGLLRIFRVLNLIIGLVVVGWFVATFIWPPFFQHLFGGRPARLNPGLLLPTLRVWLVLTLPVLATVHVLLTRLVAIVETVRAGNPFLSDNAVRLKTIAWCMLGLQLFDLVCGAMAGIMNAAGSHIEWHWWPTGWLGVALLFVLAQVFEEGTRIRTELEAMI